MFDLSSVASWPEKARQFLKKWRYESSQEPSSPVNSARCSTNSFSEKIYETPAKTKRGVKTIRLTENSFFHDFSDFCDPERKRSYAQEMSHTDLDGNEEIGGNNVPLCSAYAAVSIHGRNKYIRSVRFGPSISKIGMHTACMSLCFK